MLTYRATLRPRSAMLSPWQADTLFGHLCWVLLYRRGENALIDFLDRYREDAPPIILSNGFPEGWLPRPLLPVQRARAHAKAGQVRAMQEAKAGKGIRWVTVDEFEALRQGDQLRLPPRPKLTAHRSVLKNQINRLTSSTTPVDEDGGGNLYSLEETMFVDTRGVRRARIDISLYVKVADENWAAEARTLLEQLAHSGYGARKTVGYGHFELVRWEPFSGFQEPSSTTNGFISLSNWVPAHGDPQEGFYNTLVKYGKLGEELSRSENPFKFPLTMLTAGSAFYAHPPIEPWYGRLVQNIAPGDERVVQYAYAFAVPAHLAAERLGSEL